MILIVGKNDQIIYFNGNFQSQNILFEIYTSMDLIEIRRNTSDKMIFNFTPENSTEK